VSAKPRSGANRAVPAAAILRCFHASLASLSRPGDGRRPGMHECVFITRM